MRAHLVFGLSVLVAGGCGLGVSGTRSPSGTPDGGLVVAGDAGAPASCGRQTFPITSTKAQPNVMFVVDDSGSMGQKFTGGGQNSKWVALQGAVQSLLTAHATDAQWGLEIFPTPGAQANDPSQCTVTSPQFTVGPNAAAIISQVNGVTPAGNTPTVAALTGVLSGAGLDDAKRANYVVLMTDGAPNCGANDPQGNTPIPPAQVTSVVQQLFQSSPSVKTFVIGIGDGSSDFDGNALDDWATAGHTARNADPKYYPVANAGDLTKAFEDIVGTVASCTYALQTKPADPSLVAVTLDGAAVASDPTNGFTYDATANAVTFNGSSCDKIKSGAASKVDIEYGCPGPSIK